MRDDRALGEVIHGDGEVLIIGVGARNPGDGREKDEMREDGPFILIIGVGARYPGESRERDEMRGRAVESQRLVSYVEEQVGLNHR